MPLRGGSYLPDISCLRKETGVVSFILSPFLWCTYSVWCIKPPGLIHFIQTTTIMDIEDMTCTDMLD